MDIHQKYNSLKANIASLGPVVVAYSGGVDSTLLLKVCVDVLGVDNVLACIVTGPTQPSVQLNTAAALAEVIGVELVQVDVDLLSNEEFVANTAERCYFCKREICKMLLAIAKDRDFANVVFGTNIDDYDDHRPGNRALTEMNILSPLAQAKLTKADIRQLSRDYDLPTADLPANPCLVSRLQYHLPITAERLLQVDKAEELLGSLGFKLFRVRHHDHLARIEVTVDDISRLTAEPVRSEVADKLKSLGFKYVTVDIEGFRSGSLNEILCDDEKMQ